MRNWIVAAALAVLAGGACLGGGPQAMADDQDGGSIGGAQPVTDGLGLHPWYLVMEPDPAPEPAPAPAPAGPTVDEQIRILTAKIEVTKQIGQAAKDLNDASTSQQQAACNNAIAMLNQIFSQLEDLLKS